MLLFNIQKGERRARELFILCNLLCWVELWRVRRSKNKILNFLKPLPCWELSWCGFNWFVVVSHVRQTKMCVEIQINNLSDFEMCLNKRKSVCWGILILIDQATIQESRKKWILNLDFSSSSSSQTRNESKEKKLRNLYILGKKIYLFFRVVNFMCF